MTATTHPFERPAALTPAFDNITQQSQQTFRRILAAMAEPGTLQELDLLDSPEPLSSAAYQVCLTLMDQETSLWITPEVGSEAVLAALRFHCGCRITENAQDAVFALVHQESAKELSRFHLGSHEYPDRSATVLVEVSGLQAGGNWQLRGPGIQGQRTVGIDGFDASWQAALADNQRQFPRGVDLILTCGHTLMALPRTTRCEQIMEEDTPCT